MQQIALMEQSGQVEALVRALWRADGRETLSLHAGPQVGENTPPWDCLLLGPDAPQNPRIPPSRLLLLPGELAHTAVGSAARCVMSYGPSSRDSLTLSGTRGGHYAFSVQRELSTVTGGVVERQELILSRRSTSALTQMAATLLLLALDVPPETLPTLFHRDGKSLPLRGQGEFGIL